MKNKLITAITVIMLAVLAFALALPSSADEIDELNSQLSELDVEIAKLKDKIAKSEDNLSNLKVQKASLSTNIDNTVALKTNLDSQINELSSQITDTNDLIIAINNKIRKNEEDIASLETESADTYALIKERLRIAYEDGSTSYLQVLLQSQDFAHFLMSAERVASMLEYQTQLMQNLESSAEQTRSIREQNDKDKQDAETLMLELETKQANLKNDLADAQTLIDDLNYQYSKTANSISSESSTINAAAAQIEENERLAAEIDKQIEQLLIERQKQQNSSYTGGTLLWPLSTSYAKVSSGFGYRTYDNAFHRGIDIPCDYGAVVSAANAGTVVTATYHYSYGNYVLIDHGGGVATLYAHNSSLSVSAGDKVTAGQQIALAGSTGDSSGNHVHFEVRINGAIVDPLNNGQYYVVQP